MVLTAFILIKIDPGMDRIIGDRLGQAKEVKAVANTYGSYDILVTVEVESSRELDVFLFDKLRKISGVRETMTLINADL